MRIKFCQRRQAERLEAVVVDSMEWLRMVAIRVEAWAGIDGSRASAGKRETEETLEGSLEDIKGRWEGRKPRHVETRNMGCHPTDFVYLAARAEVCNDVDFARYMMSEERYIGFELNKGCLPDDDALDQIVGFKGVEV